MNSYLRCPDASSSSKLIVERQRRISVCVYSVGLYSSSKLRLQGISGSDLMPSEMSKSLMLSWSASETEKTVSVSQVELVK